MLGYRAMRWLWAQLDTTNGMESYCWGRIFDYNNQIDRKNLSPTSCIQIHFLKKIGVYRGFLVCVSLYRNNSVIPAHSVLGTQHWWFILGCKKLCQILQIQKFTFVSLKTWIKESHQFQALSLSPSLPPHPFSLSLFDGFCLSIKH